jgi:hypothetical protein
MSESPRHPNPGLNGYQQDVMHAEVGTLFLLSLCKFHRFGCNLDHRLHPWRSFYHLGAFRVFNAKAQASFVPGEKMRPFLGALLKFPEFRNPGFGAFSVDL